MDVRCFPGDDSRFEQRVRTAVERACTTSSDADEILASVVAELRAEYPEIRISVQDEIATYTQDVLWYVYRYGALLPYASTTKKGDAGRVA